MPASSPGSLAAGSFRQKQRQSVRNDLERGGQPPGWFAVELKINGAAGFTGALDTTGWHELHVAKPRMASSKHRPGV